MHPRRTYARTFIDCTIPHTRAHADRTSSWMRRSGARATYGFARDRRDGESGVAQNTIRSRSLRAYEYCPRYVYAPYVGQWQNRLRFFCMYAILQVVNLCNCCKDCTGEEFREIFKCLKNLFSHDKSARYILDSIRNS